MKDEIKVGDCVKYYKKERNIYRVDDINVNRTLVGIRQITSPFNYILVHITEIEKYNPIYPAIQSIKDILTKDENTVNMQRKAMYDSLESAIEKSGGCSSVFKDKILNGMTVIELIDSLGQNGVRFTTEK